MLKAALNCCLAPGRGRFGIKAALDVGNRIHVTGATQRSHSCARKHALSRLEHPSELSTRYASDSWTSIFIRTILGGASGVLGSGESPSLFNVYCPNLVGEGGHCLVGESGHTLLLRGGLRGFDPHQLRRTSLHNMWLLSAVGDLKWSLIPYFYSWNHGTYWYFTAWAPWVYWSWDHLESGWTTLSTELPVLPCGGRWLSYVYWCQAYRIQSD